MSDFAKQLAADIRSADALRAEERGRHDTENAAFVEREKLKRKLGPALWHKLRDAIVSECGNVNKELGSERYRIHDELPTKLHVIRATSLPANLRLEFHEDGSRISFDCGACVGEYLIQIDPGTGQAFLSDAYHRNFAIGSTAAHLLQECLEKAPF